MYRALLHNHILRVVSFSATPCMCDA